MPVFHIEEEIALRTWDDILNRPGYQSSVEPRKFRLQRIATVYSFKDQSARCGMSDCQEAHSRGFLVITTDEKETNLCEACGQRLLHITFNKSKNTLRTQARVREHHIYLNKVLERSDAIRERVRELKRTPRGANWLYRVLTSFRKSYPADLLAALKMLATDKEDHTILSALAEVDVDSFHLNQVKQLQGLGIFAADIREELIIKILKPLEQLESATENPKHISALARYCQWADQLDEQFAWAEYLVEEGRAFFETENLERLKSLPLSEVSTRFMQSVDWKVERALIKRK